VRYQVVRTDAEIDEVINSAAEAEDTGSRVPGESYEAGVRAAIEWVTGNTEDHPINEE
jgi:hypothetical protein